MKTIKKILLVVVIIIIAIGMFILGRKGFKYEEGYSESILLNTAKQYILYGSISTALVLIYWAIKYSKQGVISVLATAILTMLATLAFAIAVMVLIQMPVSRLFFPIILATYVASIILLTAYFEGKN